jgi:hypothetical protein
MAKISFRVNGKNQTVDAEPDMPLLVTTSGSTAPSSAAASLNAAPVRSSWTATPSAPVSPR